MKKAKFKTTQEYYKEALRYYKNAKERLKESRVEYGRRYQDLKPVREACGTAYLAVLFALDGYFLRQGVAADKLPTSTEGYQEFLRKYSAHNGKIKSAYYNVYENLHILGYYRGAGDINTVKSGFENAKFIIDTLNKHKG